ncbi:hypothetical protein HanPI659440_Chr03g0124981 [Helianthus annuus]|nr:hypothetical protein HanPI659440_Chr03g0124981 [Helianthus annuus]
MIMAPKESIAKPLSTAPLRTTVISITTTHAPVRDWPDLSRILSSTFMFPFVLTLVVAHSSHRLLSSESRTLFQNRTIL